ncbi:nucleoside hydrolase [Nocardia terpenica]|uniref:nucleoside hydrolase n=1 Tax=Nocardia terpenica TaxID=455432 RepID=UPI002FDF9B0B
MAGETDKVTNSQVEYVPGMSMDLLPSTSTEWPEVSAMPFILDTDIGFEPDDALALVLAASLPNLSLIITSDECDNQRARLARYLLEVLGRRDVPIVSGRELDTEDNWSVEDMVPEYIPAQPTGVVAAVQQVLEQHDGQIGWIGLGPMSNLAIALSDIQGLRERLVVTQQEGAFRVAPDDRAERNIDLDVSSARDVLEAGIQPWIVPAGLSFHPLNAITEESVEYQTLYDSVDPACVLLRLHLDMWLGYETSSPHLHGPLTLAQGIGMPFITTIPASIDLDEFGRIRAGDHSVYMGQSVDYVEFRHWLSDKIKEIRSVIARHPASEYRL